VLARAMLTALANGVLLYMKKSPYAFLFRRLVPTPSDSCLCCQGLRPAPVSFSCTGMVHPCVRRASLKRYTVTERKGPKRLGTPGSLLSYHITRWQAPAISRRVLPTVTHADSFNRRVGTDNGCKAGTGRWWRVGRM